jgi:succinoglycan biosynthesis protein ExoA
VTARSDGTYHAETPACSDASTGSLPSIDVLISTYNEERHVGPCLDAVLSQDYPAELVRVWLIDGGSSDDTVRIALERARANPRLTVIEEGRRLNLPAALNIGIARSSGDLVAKVDAHGYPAEDFLRRAVEAFASEGPELACVGGRPHQSGETRFGTALAMARRSRFGVGGSGYAGANTRGFVDTVQCGVYRRDALVDVGGFDPEMPYGEDEELNWRLRRAGFRILLDTRICFDYFTRSSWLAAYRQYRNYGEARVRVVRAHPEFLRLHHLVPPAALCSAGLLAVACPFAPAARRGLAGLVVVYVITGLGMAVRAARATDPGLAPSVFASFTALHAGYAIGVLSGVRRSLRRTTTAAWRTGDVR